MCDVNYLKQTNDNFGHEAGDNLLKNCAICLKETFSSIGNCYRLGGDEFIVLIENRKDNIQDYLNTFQKNINSFNNKNNTDLSIAFGYAENSLNKNNTFLDKELYKEADDNMYKMKKNQHKSNNHHLTI